MKRIITAIGNEVLNNILKRQKNILVESTDIQYQEGIIEALDKYPKTDMVILHEDIIGELELEDLIRSILIIKNDIEIILITELEIINPNKQIVKVIKSNEDYVKSILKYLLKDNYIIYETEKSKNYDEVKKLVEAKEKSKIIIKKNDETEFLTTIKKKLKKLIKIFIKKVKEKSVITVTGNYGTREDNFYSYNVKNCKSKENFSNRF